MGNYDDAVAATFIRVLAATVGYIVLVTVLRRWAIRFPVVAHRGPWASSCSAARVGPFAGVIFFMIALKHCTRRRGEHDRRHHARSHSALLSILLYKEKVRPAAGPAGRRCPWSAWRSWCSAPTRRIRPRRPLPTSLLLLQKLPRPRRFSFCASFTVG